MSKNKSKQQKILIVGSKGYIGSYLYKFLEEKKITVFGIDNLLYGKTWFDKNLQKNFLKIDCRNLNESFIKKFDCVIFLAGLSNNPIDDIFPSRAYKIVEDYTLKFAKLCKKYNVRFIFPSSCSVYGFGKKKFNEKSKLNPLSYYSKNKVAIEKKLIKLKNSQFNPIILRLATVYGSSPSIRLDLVINMFAAMIINKNKILLNSDGMAMRPHVNINFICEVIFYFILSKNFKTTIINVGNNSDNYKIIDVVKKFIKIKKKSSYAFLDNKNSVFSDSLINKRRDPRSYSVSFNKLKKYVKIKSTNLSFKDNIKNLLFFMKKLKKKNCKFIQNINFYRLQKIKKNLDNLYCNKNLIVIRKN